MPDLNFHLCVSDLNRYGYIVGLRVDYVINFGLKLDDVRRYDAQLISSIKE